MKNIIDYQYYQKLMDEKLKEKIVKDKLEELKKLKKRIKYIHQELEGMGIRNYEK